MAVRLTLFLVVAFLELFLVVVRLAVGFLTDFFAVVRFEVGLALALALALIALLAFVAGFAFALGLALAFVFVALLDLAFVVFAVARVTRRVLTPVVVLRREAVVRVALLLPVTPQFSQLRTLVSLTLHFWQKALKVMSFFLACFQLLMIRRFSATVYVLRFADLVLVATGVLSLQSKPKESRIALVRHRQTADGDPDVQEAEEVGHSVAS